MSEGVTAVAKGAKQGPRVPSRPGTADGGAAGRQVR